MQKSPVPLKYFIGQLLRENNFSHVCVPHRYIICSVFVQRYRNRIVVVIIIIIIIRSVIGTHFFLFQKTNSDLYTLYYQIQ